MQLRFKGPPDGLDMPREPEEDSPPCEVMDVKTKAATPALADSGSMSSLFVVPKGMSSRADGPCAICGFLGERMKQHEAESHAGCFVCSCGNSFRCSEDLRRHSRSTGHGIDLRFQLPDSGRKAVGGVMLLFLDGALLRRFQRAPPALDPGSSAPNMEPQERLSLMWFCLAQYFSSLMPRLESPFRLAFLSCCW